MSFFVGIDVGGTSVKGIVTDASGKAYAEGSTPFKTQTLAEDTAALCKQLISKSGCPTGEVNGIGIGCAGMIDSGNGAVVFAGNLGLKNYPLAKLVREATGFPVKITNDANAAALGVGGGIIIGGKLFEGYKSVGAEIGHTVIEYGGEKCTCGRRGCFEAYASATALTKQTKRAMEEDTGSAMWKLCTSETATAKTAFDCMDSDVTARRVVERYINYLACGLVNLANTFRPQVIMLGGGISNQGENLIAPLRKKFDKELFGGVHYAPVKIVRASLGAAAGVYGAAALAMQ